jgi:predicted permease
VAISLLLLIGAGLFLRTLHNLQKVDLGYNREKLLLVRVDAVAAGYRDAGIGGLYRQLLDRLKTIPGVRAVTASENGLFSGTESGDRITVEGYTPKKEGDDSARFDQVGPNYFSVVGIPVILGREIGHEDNETSAPVCVINDAMARFYFAGRNPIGMHITDEFPDTRTTFRIVGVAKDARDHRLRGDIPRRFYIPLFHPLGNYPPSVYFEIRTLADPEATMAAARHEIQSVDKALPIVSLRTLNDLLDRSTRQERLVAQLSTFFGILALALASIGLYGVLAYAVGRRANEIGIRMALGARPGAVVWMFLRETLVLIAAGCAAGLVAAFAATRLVASSLFGVKPADPLTLAAATAVIAAVAALAGYLPARRAAAVDPVSSLRCE